MRVWELAKQSAEEPERKQNSIGLGPEESEKQMKKLMFAAAAIAASVVIAEGITSNNIVGYMAVGNDSASAKSVGSLFVPVSGGSEFALKDIKVSTPDGEGYMLPGEDYIQYLDPASTLVTARYTYVNANILVDAFGTSEGYEWAIGWWNFEPGWGWDENYGPWIEGGDHTQKCSDLLKFPVGTAFLGMFNGDFAFTSSGEVPTQTTQLNSNGNAAYFFVNYIPRTIDINEIEVGTSEGGYMLPGEDYVQVLDPKSTLVSARYTYINAEILVDAFGTSEGYEWAIGWWNFEPGWGWDENYGPWIEGGDDTQKVKTLDVNPGDSFLGMLGGQDFVFKFPSTLKTAE